MDLFDLLIVCDHLRLLLLSRLVALVLGLGGALVNYL